MKPRELPPLNLLEENLSYNPETGELHWKKNRHSHKIKGKRAGCLSEGYWMIKIFGKSYGAHRLAYALYHKEQLSPDTLIDHIDRDKSNNRIDNLRKVDYVENGCNRKTSRKNTSGHNGVHYAKKVNKWQARIVIEGRRVNLGFFDCKEDAITARLNAEIEHGMFIHRE